MAGTFLAVVALAACGTPGGGALAQPLPTAISCQPYTYTPAPIAFTFPTGPVTAPVAEQTAADLFRACHAYAAKVADVTSKATEASGAPIGPNPGRRVWLVQVDGTITEGGGVSYGSHFLIEVDPVTGIPTVIAYG